MNSFDFIECRSSCWERYGSNACIILKRKISCIYHLISRAHIDIDFFFLAAQSNPPLWILLNLKFITNNTPWVIHLACEYSRHPSLPLLRANVVAGAMSGHCIRRLFIHHTFLKGRLFPSKEHRFVISRCPDEYPVTLFHVLGPRLQEILNLLFVETKRFRCR